MFDPSDAVTPSLSMDHFREWANAAANSFLTGGVLPTDSVVKIAQSEDLTPHQVAVLATELNKVIHTHKYASVTEKYDAANFPLADTSEAIRRLQSDGGTAKMAVALKEPVVDNGFDPFAAFGVKPEELDKTASVKHNLKTASIKAEALKQKIDDRLTMLKFAVAGAEKSFLKEARQVVLAGQSSSERMKKLGYVDHFTKQANAAPYVRKSMAKLAYALGKEGLLFPEHANEAFNYFLKEADQKAPASMISEWLDAKVINGQHPLYITLKTFQSGGADRELMQERGQVVEDRQRILHQHIRAL